MTDATDALVLSRDEFAAVKHEIEQSNRNQQILWTGEKRVVFTTVPQTVLLCLVNMIENKKDFRDDHR